MEEAGYVAEIVELGNIVGDEPRQHTFVVALEGTR